MTKMSKEVITNTKISFKQAFIIGCVAGLVILIMSVLISAGILIALTYLRPFI